MTERDEIRELLDSGKILEPIEALIVDHDKINMLYSSKSVYARQMFEMISKYTTDRDVVDILEQMIRGELIEFLMGLSPNHSIQKRLLCIRHDLADVCKGRPISEVFESILALYYWVCNEVIKYKLSITVLEKQYGFCRSMGISDPIEDNMVRNYYYQKVLIDIIVDDLCNTKVKPKQNVKENL